MATATSEAEKSLKALLTSTLRIRVNDGRIFLGAFIGTDQPMNILLTDTEEFRVEGNDTDGGGEPVGRFVGQVLIPWKIVVKIEVQEKEKEPQYGRSGRAMAMGDYIM